jgi:hypothetical protein
MQPFQVSVRTTPTRPTNGWSRIWVYGQDTWTVKRLTVNAGLRDYLNSKVGAQDAQGGT